MKRSTFPLLVILILAAVVATTSTPAAIVPENGPSAFGAGQFRYLSPETARTEIWSFSFEAIYEASAGVKRKVNRVLL